MSNDNNNRYQFRIESSQEPPQNDPAPSDSAQTAETYRREIGAVKRSMVKIVAIFCAITLVIGVGGGALIGSQLAKNNAPAVQTDAGVPGTTSAVADATSPTTQLDVQKLPQNGTSLYTPTTGNKVEMSVADVYEMTENTVVSILTEVEVNNGYYRQNSTASGAGSGVIISQDGYIVTNNHVIEGAKKITIALHNGDEYEARLIGTDDVTDIALLKIDAQNLSFAVIGNSDDLRIGDVAIVIGNPLGRLSGTLTGGYISGLDRSITMSDGTVMNLFQMDAAVNPGNSGGAVFNTFGELCGVVVAKTSAVEVEGIGFAIPVNDVLPIIDELITYGYVTGRPALGIQVITVSDTMTMMMYRVNYLGVYVSAVETENGLVPGDYIISMNDAEITTAADISNVLQGLVVGDVVKVEVLRNGEQVSVDVPLVEEGSLHA